MEPEGLDGGEGEDEEAAADALVEAAGGERAVGAREGGVVVDREAGGPRLVSRAGGGGAGPRLERVPADSLEGGFRAEGSPVCGRRRRGDGGEARSAAEHLVVVRFGALGRGC
jgi:hypothetical protein